MTTVDVSVVEMPGRFEYVREVENRVPSLLLQIPFVVDDQFPVDHGPP
jgi:hypothetical protein